VDPSAQANLTHPQTRPRQHRGRLSASLVLFLLCATGLVGIFSAWMALQVVLWRYQARIYPNVYVLGVNLGGLTLSEASERLTRTFTHTDAGRLILSDGQREWPIPWRDAGLRLDVDTTVRKAFNVGRAEQGLRTFLTMREEPHFVAPVLVVDPAVARRVLERMAPEVEVPPTDATLLLRGDRFVAMSSQPGRVMDVETAVEKVLVAPTHLGRDSHVALPFQVVPPRIADVSGVHAQAEEMLSRQVHISTYDMLTGESFAWTLGRDTILNWLRTEQTEDGRGLSIVVVEEAMQSTLAGLATELGEDRSFSFEQATQQVLSVFQEGGGAVKLRVTRLPRTCTVQSGDTLSTIAARFGMPLGLIVEANPELDLDRLSVGQQLAIPSQDVLTPYFSRSTKRIVISIAGQRLRAYEQGTLLYDWPISTGMASSPTYTGIFQVLSKEEKAYASEWDLWMPHFLAVYRAGGEVYNGIHGLPILSSGRRLWEGALGRPASYGCIILGIKEAETLYNWADIGVLVIIE